MVPPIRDDATVEEWARVNGQPTLCFELTPSVDTDPGHLGSREVSRRFDDQAAAITELGKKLDAQTAIIQNQARFIGELQETNRKQEDLIATTVKEVASEMAVMRGLMMELLQDGSGSKATDRS